MSLDLHFVALPLLDFVYLIPSAFEVEIAAFVGVLGVDSDFFALERVLGVGKKRLVVFLLGQSLDVILLVGLDELLDVALLAAFDDGSRGVPETPA